MTTTCPHGYPLNDPHAEPCYREGCYVLPKTSSHWCPHCDKVLDEWPCMSEADASKCANSNPDRGSVHDAR